MNGDGKPDLVDSENSATENESDVFYNGSQKYWKVYLNTGSGFSPTAIQWNIPATLDTYEDYVNYNNHEVIDMNGDGKPDLVDSEDEATSGAQIFFNGNQKYWKVYLNTGSGFSTTAIQWNMPAVLDTYEEQVNYTLHAVIDMNGDGKPDLVDSENSATENESDVFYNGSQKYWKVYLSTGSGFSPTAIQWNIPATLDTYEDYVNYNNHVVIDMNGDGKPDLVDSEDEATSGAQIFFNGNQKYWKVYLNNAPSLETGSFAVAPKIVLYPNPVKDVLTISADAAMDAVSIYNLFGQMVMSQTLGKNTAEVNVSGLASGTYLVKITGNQSVSTLKIIKQ